MDHGVIMIINACMYVNLFKKSIFHEILLRLKARGYAIQDAKDRVSLPIFAVDIPQAMSLSLIRYDVFAGLL